MKGLSKNGLKKAVAIGGALAICAMSNPMYGNLMSNIGTAMVSAAETDEASEELSFVNSGYIKLSGQIKTAAEGETVVIYIVSGQIAQNPFENDGENTVYMAETTTDAKGNWEVAFSLHMSGKYRAFIGASAMLKNQVIDFSYINKAAFDAAIAVITDSSKTDAEIIDAIKADEASLGLGDITINDYDGLVKLAKYEVKSDDTPKETELKLKKSNMIVELNAKRLNDLKVYKDVLESEDEKYTDYLTNGVLTEIADDLSGKSFDGFASFDEAVKNAVILNVANNGTTENIKGLLKAYSKELGITESKITDNSVSALKSQKPTQISTIVSYINGYKEKETSGSDKGPGGGGGGGSSYGSGSNNYMGTTAETTETEEETVYAFDDIKDVPWAAEAITQLTYRGVLNGKGARVFAPNDNVTREEFAKIISLGFKLNLVDVDCPFEDVNENDWSYPYIRSAYIAGVVNGVSDTMFGYGENISREDLCVMTDRMINAGKLSLGDTSTEITFNDESEISDYAVDSVKRLASAGIISGDNGNFKPKDNATRAEAAKIVYLALVKTGR